jgi:hypothetical protein
VGPPGCGKTRKAREENPGAYFKLQNKWWDGYQGHNTVIMDDLGPDNAKYLITHLKLWADPWQNHPGEIKGGQVALTYNKMIVTSNYEIGSFCSGVDAEALHRRFEVIRWDDY